MKRFFGCLGVIGFATCMPAGANPLLEGRVQLSSGGPAAGAQVMLFDLTNLRRVALATTDGRGWFSLDPGIWASSLPKQFHLGQNYPNPFNPSTTIPFQLPAATHVRLEVYNLLGQRVATLVNGVLPAGSHTVRWDGTDVAGRPAGAGLYLYQLRGEGISLTHRMVLIDGQAGLLSPPSDHGTLSAGGEAVMETGASILGLTVSGPGLAYYVDPAFRLEAGRGLVDLVVEEQGASRGKVAAGALLGDVDSNGHVDIVDALLIMVFALDLDRPSVPVPNNGDMALGDVNRDGMVDISDALLVLAWLTDPLDPSFPSGIGKPVVTVASLSPDPTAVAFQPDGSWHQFAVHATEPVELVVNPVGAEPNLEIAILGGLSTHCPPEQNDRFVRNNGQFVYLAACTEGTGTVELRRKSDGAILQTYTVTISELLPAPTGTLASKMYWTSPGKIHRADRDGSNVEDLVAFGSPRNLALDMLAGKMYWTDPGIRKIWRADLDGSQAESLIAGLISPAGLALDIDAGKIYWTDSGFNRIQRANLDGSRIEPLVTLGLHSPEGLALDADGGKIYWSDFGTNKIQRANLDGSQIEDLVTTGLSSPEGLALDADGGKIYWADFTTDKIQRANLDGSQVEDLVTTGLSIPKGLALEVRTGKMFWTDSGTGKIQRANFDGSQVEDLHASTSSTPVGLALGSPVAALSPNPGATFPRDGITRLFTVLASEPVVVVVNPAGAATRMLIADSSGAFNDECLAKQEDSLTRRHGEAVYLGACTPGEATVELRRASDQAVLKTYIVRVSGKRKIYWTNAGRQDKIQRADVDGTNLEDLVTTGLNEPIDLALDVTKGKMYWTDQGTDKIQRANLDGSNIEDLVTRLDYPVGLALDLAEGKMYWTDMNTDKIQRGNLDGSQVEDLVTTGLSRPRGIALDLAAGKMYWTDQGTDKIQRANLDGSDIEDLVTTGTNDLDRLALDLENGSIYWTDSKARKVQRGNLDGSDVEDLVTGLSEPRGIALDLAGGKMYWTDSGTDRIQSANLDGSNIQTLVTGIVGPTSIFLE